MGLPPLPDKVIAEQLANDITDAERATLQRPGCMAVSGMARASPLMRPIRYSRNCLVLHIRRPSRILTHHLVMEIVCLLSYNPTCEHRCPLCASLLCYRHASAHASVCYCVHSPTLAQELSVLDDPKDHKSGKTSAQNQNAGWYNRFVQTGTSDHETKTSGCFGGQSPPLSHHTHASISCTPVRVLLVCDCTCVSNGV